MIMAASGASYCSRANQTDSNHCCLVWTSHFWSFSTVHLLVDNLVFAGLQYHQQILSQYLGSDDDAGRLIKAQLGNAMRCCEDPTDPSKQLIVCRELR